MSYINIETVKAISIHGKFYHSPRQAAIAYAEAATGQFYYNCFQKGKVHAMTYGPYQDWSKPIKEKFYRRSYPIFEKYFNGE